MKTVTVYHPDHVHDRKHPRHGYLQVPAELVHLRIPQGWKVVQEKKRP